LLYKKECKKSSFYFVFCSKKWVPFCFHWVCQLCELQTKLSHLQTVLSLLTSQGGLN
jgi:hypothetical protein